MGKTLEVYGKFLNVLEKIVAALLAILTAAMVILYCYQVFLRYVLNGGNAWSEELVRYLFVWTVLLGSSIATRHYSHLTVNMFIDLFPKKVKAILQLVTCALIFYFLYYLFTLGLELVLSSLEVISAGVNQPMAYFYASVPVGAALMMLNLVEYTGYRIMDFFGMSKTTDVAEVDTQEVAP